MVDNHGDVCCRDAVFVFHCHLLCFCCARESGLKFFEILSPSAENVLLFVDYDTVLGFDGSCSITSCNLPEHVFGFQ